MTTVVLDADGLSQLAQHDQRVEALMDALRELDPRVVVSAVTLAEVLRGSPRDAAVHRLLGWIDQLDVTPRIGRAAGELLGVTGSNETIDAIVAATALDQRGPVMVLTSDPDDLTRLTASSRVAIQKV